MLRRGTRCLAFWLLLALTACASFDDAVPPDVSLSNLRLVGGGLLDQELLVDLRIRNPNDFELPLDGLTFNLELNGEPFADGFTNEAVTVPRLGEAKVPVTASINLIDLVQQMLALGREGDLNYRIDGLAYLRGLTGRKVPYETTGRLQLMPRSEEEDEDLVPIGQPSPLETDDREAI